MNQEDSEKAGSSHQGLGLSFKEKQENNQAYEARNILNPVQKRYEDSKDSF